MRRFARIRLGLAIGLVGCIGIIGCTVPGAHRASLLDPELRRTLELSSDHPKWNEAGQLVAGATIKNRSYESQHIMVQTLFLGAEGQVLETDVPWENRVVPEYGTLFYRRASLGEGAVDFRINIRRGRPQ